MPYVQFWINFFYDSVIIKKIPIKLHPKQDRNIHDSRPGHVTNLHREVQ